MVDAFLGYRQATEKQKHDGGCNARKAGREVDHGWASYLY